MSWKQVLTISIVELWLLTNDYDTFDMGAYGSIWEHTRDCHAWVVGRGGGMEDYKVKVAQKFQKCLYRQVDEDVRMQEFETDGGVLLNSKYEYYTPKSVPSAVMGVAQLSQPYFDIVSNNYV